MGKSLTATQLQQFTKSIISSSHKPKSPKHTHKTSPPPREVRLDSVPFKTNSNNNNINSRKIIMEETSSSSNSSVSLDEKQRAPLAHVVSDCVNRWFQDTLKEAKAGDVTMQVLVSQMYFNGYGVPKHLDMAYEWIRKATRTRHSAWKVYKKRPGYNVSDSNSDESEDEI